MWKTEILTALPKSSQTLVKSAWPCVKWRTKWIWLTELWAVSSVQDLARLSFLPKLSAMRTFMLQQCSIFSIIHSVTCSVHQPCWCHTNQVRIPTLASIGKFITNVFFSPQSAVAHEQRLVVENPEKYFRSRQGSLTPSSVVDDIPPSPRPKVDFKNLKYNWYD